MATRIKEKAQKVAETREKRPHAYVRNIRISPFKVRIVLKLIRGKSVNEAIAILQSTPKSASPVLLKLIKSATANAEHNMGIARIDLKIAEVFADPGATMKRAMPRAKGRSNPILKRSCHITVILDLIGETLKGGIEATEYARPKRVANAKPKKSEEALAKEAVKAKAEPKAKAAPKAAPKTAPKAAPKTAPKAAAADKPKAAPKKTAPKNDSKGEKN
ncbi:MAG: 50S ribosomal protein L22 [Firmicutes bacterium]|nr:50S ribosomal protein L22 [Bacillota bacterium]